MFESIMPKSSALSLKIPSIMYNQEMKLAPLNDTICNIYSISVRNLMPSVHNLCSLRIATTCYSTNGKLESRNSWLRASL